MRPLMSYEGSTKVMFFLTEGPGRSCLMCIHSTVARTLSFVEGMGEQCQLTYDICCKTGGVRSRSGRHQICSRFVDWMFCLFIFGNFYGRWRRAAIVMLDIVFDLLGGGGGKDDGISIHPSIMEYWLPRLSYFLRTQLSVEAQYL